MCGIFGQSTNNPKKINQANIKILGIFNESRGKNSCGITIDGEIYYGLDSEKLFSDFMKGRKFDAKVFPNVFGHTRQSSVGIVNKFNAHPFGFGENEKNAGFKFIGVHNGTLHNYKELAAKYEISDTAPYLNDNGQELTRDKIDSEILLEILYRERNFDVLSDYNGRAALVWTDTDKPDVIYLFSGKSRGTVREDMDKMAEERPLHVYIESKNNFYFSSLPEGLYAIGAEESECFQIDYNTVYIVKNGDFAHAKKVTISRDENYHESYGGAYVGNFSKTYGTNSTVRKRKIIEGHHRYDFVTSREERARMYANLNKAFESTDTPINIYKDKPLKLQASYKDTIYSEKLRFFRNGHRINGIFIWIPNYGFQWMADTHESFEKRLTMISGVKFIDGVFDYGNTYLGKGEVIYTEGDEVPKVYYFLNGIMLLERLDYTTTKAIIDASNGKYVEDYIKFSHMSVHPIIDFSYKTKPDDDQLIYHKGKLFTGLADCLGFEKIYNIQDGNLISIRTKENTELKENTSDVILLHQNTYSAGSTVFNPNVLKAARDYILDFESVFEKVNTSKDIKNNSVIQTSLEEELNEQLKNEEVDIQEDNTYFKNLENEIKQKEADDAIEAEIHKSINPEMLDAVIKLQKCRTKLQDYKEHSLAKELIRLLDTIDKTLENFISAK